MQGPIINKIFNCSILIATGIQLLFAYPENHVEIWLVILFLSRKKFHAKQIFVLSSAMKLGPVVIVMKNAITKVKMEVTSRGGIN